MCFRPDRPAPFQVILFAADAIEKLKSAGKIVLLEGREQVGLGKPFLRGAFFFFLFFFGGFFLRGTPHGMVFAGICDASAPRNVAAARARCHTLAVRTHTMLARTLSAACSRP